MSPVYETLTLLSGMVGRIRTNEKQMCLKNQSLMDQFAYS